MMIQETFAFGVPDCKLEVVMYPNVSGICQLSVGFIGVVCPEVVLKY